MYWHSTNVESDVAIKTETNTDRVRESRKAIERKREKYRVGESENNREIMRR